MVASLAHRGPDESGFWEGDGVGLGIARLAIIDVEKGHQPVFSIDKSIVVVCNGEIYNSQELAGELTQQGVELASSSDVEVIPHLYRRHGLGFVHRLRGMFAIALWDVEERLLLLVRDRVGKKPLFYAQENGGLIFGSEARALLATGWQPEPNLGALDHVLAFSYLPIHSGAWEGLLSVPPGHYVVWQENSIRQERYWAWEPGDPLPSRGLAETLEEALEEAVRIRLVSERPVGAFLSGGVDSTIVTALMARLHSGPVKTFSIGFDDPAYDESGYARQVAEFLETDHTELIIEPKADEILERIAETFDQPFADSSAIPTMWLSELASRDVVVALSGDGGDEAFGGYERYVVVEVLQRLNWVWNALSSLTNPMSAMLTHRGQHRLGRLVRGLRSQPSLGRRYRGVMEYQPDALRAQLWTRDAQRHFDIAGPARSFDLIWGEIGTDDPLDHMRAMDFRTYLPGDLLTKVDVSSMSCSLEVRSPLLDQEVLALAARIPPNQLRRGTTTKRLLRQIAYGLVPRELIDRPKRGFAIPRAAWLRGPLREQTRDLLLDDTAHHRGWFNRPVVESLLDQHDDGTDRDLYLWPILMVELWARRWLDRETVA
jgi:asparagine synthase (glutamine-hydrolysing)